MGVGLVILGSIIACLSPLILVTATYVGLFTEPSRLGPLDGAGFYLGDHGPNARSQFQYSARTGATDAATVAQQPLRL